jgi:hypothetical protein
VILIHLSIHRLYDIFYTRLREVIAITPISGEVGLSAQRLGRAVKLEEDAFLTHHLVEHVGARAARDVLINK